MSGCPFYDPVRDRVLGNMNSDLLASRHEALFSKRSSAESHFPAARAAFRREQDVAEKKLADTQRGVLPKQRKLRSKI